MIIFCMHMQIQSLQALWKNAGIILCYPQIGKNVKFLVTFVMTFFALVVLQ